MLNILKILPVIFILYLGAGLIHSDINILMFCILSTFFTVGIFLFFIVLKFCISGKSITGEIIDKKRPPDSSSPTFGKGFIYTLKFNTLNQTITYKMPYPPISKRPSIGDKIPLLVIESSKMVILRNDIYILGYFGIVSLATSLYFFLNS